MRRALAGLLVLAAAVGIGTACQGPQHDRDELSAAIDRTLAVARAELYEERAGGHLTQARAVIADDLRYRVDATVDGNPAASTVVVRDARALQVRDPVLLPGLSSQLPPAGAGAAGASIPLGPNSTSPQVQSRLPAFPTALKLGHWVVDDKGAAALRPALAERYAPGPDPLFDAVDVLQYVREAMSTAVAVVKLNVESTGYRPRFDHLPHPQPGVSRYDLVMPNIPPGAGAKSAAEQVIGTSYFREMSVYVSGGRVVAVREIVSVRNRLLDPKSNLDLNLKALGVAVPPGAGLDVKSRALLTALNQRLALFRQPLIRERTMDAAFSFGPQPDISMPAGAAAASLAGIDDHGQVLYENN